MPIASSPSHEDALADATEAAVAGGDLGFQHVTHAGAEAKISVSDDGFGDAAGTVVAGCTHGGDAVDELHFADRRHLGGAGLAVHRLAFDEDRGDDLVAAADVGEQVGQEVLSAVRRVPEVMMRIDDWQVGLERRLGGAPGQPCLQVGIVSIDQTSIFALGIAGSSHFHSLCRCLV